MVIIYYIEHLSPYHKELKMMIFFTSFNKSFLKIFILTNFYKEALNILKNVPTITIEISISLKYTAIIM